MISSKRSYYQKNNIYYIIFSFHIENSQYLIYNNEVYIKNICVLHALASFGPI